MAREKVPSVYWVGGNVRQAGKFWIATFANEGAEKLAEYVKTLRSEYRRMRADRSYSSAELAAVIAVGKHAVAVYNRHFGEI